MYNKKENNTFIKSKNIENVFTDLIEIQVNNETVSFKIGIKDLDTNKATISHNVIMTLPHFMRFAKIVGEASDNIIEQITKESKKS